MPKKRVFLLLGSIFIVYCIYFIVHSNSHEPIPQRCISSMGNLKHIGIGLWMYAEDNNDVFPDNLEQTVVYYGKSNRDIFESPLKPKDFDGPSYIYVSDHSYQDAKEKEKYIIAYENPEYRAEYTDDKVNTLFLDGHVERLEKEEFLFELQKTYEHLGKPMPEIKFED